jgi:hypothetical protein
MRAIRYGGVIALVAVSASGCGKNEDDETCPEPAPSLVGPSARPDLSTVPACKVPEQDR